MIGVLKDPRTRGGSKSIHEQLDEGDVLEISAPRNHFPLAREAKKSLLLAGGIGITPILCKAERLATIGAATDCRPDRHERMVWAYRFPTLTTFHALGIASIGRTITTD